ncbi:MULTISPECIES: C40 family peptidase [unclassified Dysgonomonas]|uniref:C40 family peptidase n=1 Tax=unclassified Dysgonomonas TaxID=2630389 RepID=UPI0006817990|nr:MULTISPECIES: C40 family peptidase [unclassified Dysgonomonas]MBD8346410.1 C40 family peptidase [Dysgonomonas sp. HGC4]MBF0574675.1 C40 family peptidase [Dysgonomonas sp. GY617]
MQFKNFSIKTILAGLSFMLICVTLSAKDKKNETQQEPAPKVSTIEKKIGLPLPNDSTILSLYSEAVAWLKTPYRRGGTSPKGMDCSGLTTTIYKNVFGIKLQRSSRDISAQDVKDLNKDDLKPGDLVFFGTSSRKGKRVNHVGVFLGDRRFIHASTSNGVIISSLDEAYYRRTWIKGGRVKQQEKISTQKIPTT